jgi:hypothetical protein
MNSDVQSIWFAPLCQGKISGCVIVFIDQQKTEGHDGGNGGEHEKNSGTFVRDNDVRGRLSFIGRAEVDKCSGPVAVSW